VPVCSATKSMVLPRVLFVLPDSSSLRGAIEGGNRPGSSWGGDRRIRAFGATIIVVPP
jgi:hypothetical protein